VYIQAMLFVLVGIQQMLQSRLEKQAFQVFIEISISTSKSKVTIPPRKAGISREVS